MTTINLPTDSENRQLIARLTPRGWQLIERDTLRANSARLLPVDEMLAEELDRLAAKLGS